MGKAVCIVSAAALRLEPTHRSEMVSQMLYGESVEVLESAGSFSKVRMHYDGYEGYADSTQLTPMSDEEFSLRKTKVYTESYGRTDETDGETLFSMGSELLSDGGPEFLPVSRQGILYTAWNFINTPYLWSGRSFFGIDCSGFTQIVYKVHGIVLPRDAHQQAEKGTVLDFVEESQPGDLAFFEDEEGRIVHVGMMLKDQKIIHAYGKVRIDMLDSSGIYNADQKRHTHRLRFVKNLLS